MLYNFAFAKEESTEEDMEGDDGKDKDEKKKEGHVSRVGSGWR